MKPDTIGSRIKNRREALNLSAKQLGAAANVSVGSLSRYENDIVIPKYSVLSRIASSLKTSVEYLSCITDNSSPNVLYIKIDMGYHGQIRSILERALSNYSVSDNEALDFLKKELLYTAAHFDKAYKAGRYDPVGDEYIQQFIARSHGDVNASKIGKSDLEETYEEINQLIVSACNTGGDSHNTNARRVLKFLKDNIETIPME